MTWRERAVLWGGSALLGLASVAICQQWGKYVDERKASASAEMRISTQAYDVKIERAITPQYSGRTHEQSTTIDMIARDSSTMPREVVARRYGAGGEWTHIMVLERGCIAGYSRMPDAGTWGSCADNAREIASARKLLEAYR